jgi:hypothetical protein
VIAIGASSIVAEPDPAETVATTVLVAGLMTLMLPCRLAGIFSPQPPRPARCRTGRRVKRGKSLRDNPTIFRATERSAWLMSSYLS